MDSLQKYVETEAMQQHLGDDEEPSLVAVIPTPIAVMLEIFEHCLGGAQDEGSMDS